MLAKPANTSSKGGRALPEKLGAGVQPSSQNLYPIYSQNLRFAQPSVYDLTKISLFYLWSRSCRKQKLWWAFVDDLVDDDEDDVASFKMHNQFKTRVQKPYPI